MKKIAIFSNMYPTTEHPTYGIFVKNQVQLLSTKMDVDVVAIDEPGKGKMTTLKKYISWFFRSFFYMLKNRKKLSLTHAHYAFPTGFISLIGKKILGIPYVVTVHGGDIDKMAKKSPAIAKLTAQVLNGAETVIVVGERLKANVIERFGVHEDRVKVMSMGVNTAVFKPVSKGVTRETIGLENNRKIILFVGNIIKEKGILELIEAFRITKEAYPESSLYLIGSQRNRSFVEEVKSSIRGLEGVYFKEPLGQADLARWMGAADILTLPSHHEGFGLVALEAMASGAKVVGTDVGGLSYLLADGAGVLVKPKNPEALAEGLKAALEVENTVIDETVVQERVAAHSYEQILQSLLAVYKTAGKA